MATVKLNEKSIEALTGAAALAIKVVEQTPGHSSEEKHRLIALIVALECAESVVIDFEAYIHESFADLLDQ